MTWVRKDDRMPWHRKVAPLSDAAYRLLDESICWANANLTDGRVALAELAEISKRGRPKLAVELVGRGLWHEAGTACPSEHCPPSGVDGWVIHDYWEYQPSRAKVQQERDAKAKRQQRWMDAKRNGRDASHPPSQDASIDAAPNPTQTRPAPKGSGAGPRAIADRHPASQGDGDQRIAQCPKHVGQLAHNCAACRSEKLGAE